MQTPSYARISWPCPNPGDDSDDALEFIANDAEDALGERFGGLTWETGFGLCFYLIEPVTSEDVATIHGLASLGPMRPASASAWQVESTGTSASWIEKWRHAFQPLRAGRFHILTPWMLGPTQPTMAPGELLIVVDPQMAFGTGQHETTRLCLRALGERETQLAGARVADIGAGSAILAMAALKLGASSPILCTEIDGDCLGNVHDNLSHNSLPAECLDYRLTNRVPQEWLGSCNLVMCNMLSERFRPLLPSLKALLHGSGPSRLLLSGYLSREIDEVEGWCTELGLVLHERLEEADWRASLWGLA
jgi:ribosomal protein L11 methyltransferase